MLAYALFIAFQIPKFPHPGHHVGHVPGTS
jgi:hypothetical protein